MVEGRISKFLGEICLVDQVFVIDGESKVGKAVEAAAPGAAVKGFAMFVLGEGVEKKEEDFAAEVAAAAGLENVPRSNEIGTAPRGPFSFAPFAASF